MMSRANCATSCYPSPAGGIGCQIARLPKNIFFAGAMPPGDVSVSLRRPPNEKGDPCESQSRIGALSLTGRTNALVIAFFCSALPLSDDTERGPGGEVDRSGAPIPKVSAAPRVPILFRTTCRFSVPGGIRPWLSGAVSHAKKYHSCGACSFVRFERKTMPFVRKSLFTVRQSKMLDKAQTKSKLSPRQTILARESPSGGDATGKDQGESRKRAGIKSQASSSKQALHFDRLIRFACYTWNCFVCGMTVNRLKRYICRN